MLLVIGRVHVRRWAPDTPRFWPAFKSDLFEDLVGVESLSWLLSSALGSDFGSRLMWLLSGLRLRWILPPFL